MIYNIINFLLQFKAEIAFSISVIGVSLRIYQWLFFLTKKKLCYYELETSGYKSIIFWNGGNDTIRNEDFPLKGKLSISSNSNELELNIKKMSDNFMSLKLERNENYISINFDYLEKGEFFVLETTDKSNLTITGKLVGGKGLINKSITLQLKYLPIVSDILDIFIFSSFCAFCVWLFPNVFNYSFSSNTEFKFAPYLGAFVIMLFASMLKLPKYKYYSKLLKYVREITSN